MFSLSETSERIFQSTPSVGRATTPQFVADKINNGISIHALRGEGDRKRSASM